MPGQGTALWCLASGAVVVALVTALWPWLTRTQRVMGVVVAVFVTLNRLYIGAHWPLDILGGAATGLVAGACAWLIARRWPIRLGAASATSAR